MNRGEYTASWKKMLLTVLNLGCVGIAGLIVRLSIHPYMHNIRSTLTKTVRTGSVHLRQVHSRQPEQ